MVIAEPDVLGGLKRVMNLFILSQENLKDIFELRLMLEMGMAELLCARKTPEDINELEAIVEKQCHLSTLSKEDEVGFHGKLYDMTWNKTFRWFQTLLFPVFDYVFRESYEQGERIDIANPVTHYDLVQVLKSGNSVNFRKAMYTYLSLYYKSIIELKR